MKGCKNCPAYAKCTVTYRGSACAALRGTYGIDSDPEIMTNGDCIRAMNDDDMAEQFVINLDGLRPCRVYLSAPTGKMYLSRTEAVRVTRLWIQQPYKEDA